MVLAVNSDYFLKQLYPVDLSNDEVLCSLWGTDCVLKYNLDELRLQRVNFRVPVFFFTTTLAMCPQRYTAEIGPVFTLLIILSCPKVYHRPDHPTRGPIVKYHENAAPKPKNICLYSTIYETALRGCGLCFCNFSTVKTTLVFTPSSIVLTSRAIETGLTGSRTQDNFSTFWPTNLFMNSRNRHATFCGNWYIRFRATGYANTHTITHDFNFIIRLAEIPGVARDSR
jgi:hypothetical protein